MCHFARRLCGNRKIWQIISKTLVFERKFSEAQQIVSEYLSATLSFMKRQIVCHIESSDTEITVVCKNYYVKTLIEEYESLFSIKPSELENWKFVSVNCFENY